MRTQGTYNPSMIATAKTALNVSIALIPAGMVVGFLHGGLGLGLMVLGWCGVLWYDGPAHGHARFGPTFDPQPPTSEPPKTV